MGRAGSVPNRNPRYLLCYCTYHCSPKSYFTAEASWGADPLELHGGFHNLHFDEHANFRSSLATDGTVSWSRRIHEPLHAVSSSCKANDVSFQLSTTFLFEFPDIDWPSLQVIYGWAALQWQGWVRGSLFVHGNISSTVMLNIQSVIEFWIDGEHFCGGDYYAYGRAPCVLHLLPGRHVLELRLVRDVRVFGGTGNPDLPVQIDVSVACDELATDPQRSLFPNTLNGRLASEYATLPVTNVTESPVEICGLASVDKEDGSISAAGLLSRTYGNKLTLPEYSYRQSFARYSGVSCAWANQAASFAFTSSQPQL